MGRINEWERGFLSNIADRWSLSSRQRAVETGLRRHLASRLRFRGVALVSPANEGFENEATEIHDEHCDDSQPAALHG